MATAKQVQMKVVDRLTAIRAIVDDHAETIIQPFLICYALGRQQELT